MRTALITTTINIPHVLKLYRKLDPSVRFFVAGDEKTPIAAYDFCQSIDNCVFYSPPMQRDLGYECSRLIGWNTIARRNIALLEALKRGADVIITIDDDNIPISIPYFAVFHELFCGFIFSELGAGSWSGLKVSSPTYWFDPASLQFPTDGKPVVQRGFPQHLSAAGGQAYYEPITDVRIGIAQGMILGDPDTSAVDRISRHPEVHQVSELLRAGIVTDPRDTWVPINSQNTAFIRELAPAFLMVPQFKRYDDILAGLVAQRAMREKGLYVHLGQPFVFQQRNTHDLVKDLKSELWGMERIEHFMQWLSAFPLNPSKGTTCQMRDLFHTFKDEVWQAGVGDLVSAWCNDCEKVMK